MVSIQDIARNVGISAGDVQQILVRAPARYKVYEIPKRSGGTRTISQPSRELKLIQRYLMRSTFSKLRISESAMAYREGVSIRHNALAHANSRYVLKLDFTSFFHSFRPADMDYVLRQNGMAVDKHELTILKLASYWRPRASNYFMFAMGAPTSPMLTNAIMYEFDQRIAEACARAGVKFTRYADDITLSGNEAHAVLAVEQLVRGWTKSMEHPRLHFNDDKRGFYGPGQKKMVTGLVVTPDGKISIGRDRKRLISAGVHWWTVGKIKSEMHAEQLRGLIAFAHDAEPEFVASLSRKYGAKIVGDLLRRQKTHFWTPSSLPRTKERFFS